MHGKVFITGANGYVGAALAEHLLRCYPGIRVVALVKELNYKTPLHLLGKLTVVNGDICDGSDALAALLAKYEIDQIFHLASLTALRICHIEPVAAFDVNTMGTVYLLDAARRCKVAKIVCASSDKCYGTQAVMPYAEPMSIGGDDWADAYSTSKACGDMIARSFARSYDMDISIVRSGNIYGGKLGHFGADLNLSRLVPSNILKCLIGKPPVLFTGTESFKREWLFIADVATAYETVAEKGQPGTAYNVGGTGAHSPAEVVTEIIKVTGYDGETELCTADYPEIKHQWLDASRLRQLGWRPQYDLPTGISLAVEWYRDYLDRLRKGKVAGPGLLLG